MLLNCGHDMCKNCIKNMFKKNKMVTCEVCQVGYKYVTFYLTLYSIIDN